MHTWFRPANGASDANPRSEQRRAGQAQVAESLDHFGDALTNRWLELRGLNVADVTSLSAATEHRSNLREYSDRPIDRQTIGPS